MFCPNCGKQNAGTAIFCNSCGKPLPSAAAAAPAPAPAAAPAPAPVTASAPAPPPPAPPAPPAAPVYSAPPSTPMPYAPARTSKNRSGVVIVILLVLAAAGVGGYLYLRNIDQEAPEARIARLMREAAGVQPVKTGFVYNMSKMKKFDDTFRDEFRKLMQLNRDYMAQEKNADMSAISSVGKPESFADPTLAADGLRQLHALYAIDMGQEQKVQQIVAELRNIFETADISASDREAALKNFDAGIAEPLSKRNVVVSAEQAWVQSIDDVYDYATTNHAAFMMNNGQLIITDNDVLQNFNSKARDMDARRSEFLEKQEAFSKDQGNSIQKMGLSPKDMGMQ